MWYSLRDWAWKASAVSWECYMHCCKECLVFHWSKTKATGLKNPLMLILHPRKCKGRKWSHSHLSQKKRFWCGSEEKSLQTRFTWLRIHRYELSACYSKNCHLLAPKLIFWLYSINHRQNLPWLVLTGTKITWLETLKPKCLRMHYDFLIIPSIVLPGENLPYPSGVLAAEIILLFILAGLEAVRIFFGKALTCTLQCFHHISVDGTGFHAALHSSIWPWVPCSLQARRATWRNVLWAWSCASSSVWRSCLEPFIWYCGRLMYYGQRSY